MENDADAIRKLGIEIVLSDLLEENEKVRHNPAIIAGVALGLAREGRRRRIEQDNRTSLIRTMAKQRFSGDSCSGSGNPHEVAPGQGAASRRRRHAGRTCGDDGARQCAGRTDFRGRRPSGGAGAASRRRPRRRLHPQTEQKGTGHAVLCGREQLARSVGCW